MNKPKHNLEYISKLHNAINIVLNDCYIGYETIGTDEENQKFIQMLQKAEEKTWNILVQETEEALA